MAKKKIAKKAKPTKKAAKPVARKTAAPKNPPRLAKSAAPKKPVPKMGPSRATKSRGAQTAEIEILNLVRSLRAEAGEPAALFEAAAEILKEHIGCGLLNFFVKRDFSQAGSALELVGLYHAEQAVYFEDPNPESNLSLSANHVPPVEARGATIRSGGPGFPVYRFALADEESGEVDPEQIQPMGRAETIASTLLLPIALPGQKRPAGLLVCALFGGVPPYGEPDRVTADITGGLFEDLLCVRGLAGQKALLDANRQEDRAALQHARQEREQSEASLLSRQAELEREIGHLKNEFREQKREISQKLDLEKTRELETLTERHKQQRAQSEEKHRQEVEKLQAEIQETPELRKRLSELEQTRSRLETELQKERERAAAESGRQQTARQGLEQRLTASETELGELRAERTGIAAKFEGRITELQRDKDETEKQAELRVKNYERKLATLNEEFTVLRDRQEADGAERAAEKKALEERVAALVAELEQYRQYQSEATTLRDELSSKETVSRTKESELGDKIRQLEATIETTRAELSAARAEHERTLAHEKSEFESARKELERGYEERIAELSRTLAGARDDREAALRTLEERKRDFNAKVAALESKTRDADKGVKTLTDEKQAALTKIATLEKELADTRETARATRQELETERKQSGARIADLEKTVQRHEATIGNLTLEKSRLETQVAGLTDELEKTRALAANLEQELKLARSSHAERSSSLEQELALARAQIQELAEAKQKLEQELATVRQEFNAHQTRFDQTVAGYDKQVEALTTERNENQRRLQQAENNYHQKIYELNQEVDRSTQRLTRQKREVEDELEKTRAEHEEKRKEFETALKAETGRAAGLAGEITRLEKIITERESTLRSLEERLAASELAGRSLTEERDTARQAKARLDRELETTRQAFTDEKSELQKRHEDILTARELELKKARGEIETLQERADSLDQRLAGAEADLRGLRARKKENEETIRELTTQLDTRARELAEHQERIKKLLVERDGLKNDLTTRGNELGEARGQVKQLKQELGIHRERETRLEQDIARLEEKIHNLKTQITAGKGRETEMETAIAGFKKEIDSYKTDLAEMQAKEKRLNEDLTAARERERGSKEEGHLLASITHSISNVVELSDKLQFVVDRAFEDCGIERIALFSLVGENQLRLEDGFWSKHRLNFLKHRHFSMSDTAFGQAIASGKPQRVKPQKALPNPDLPDPIHQAISQYFAAEKLKNSNANLLSYLLVPLSESGRVLGLLTVAAPKADAFSDQVVRLMENVSPVLAIGLKYEHNLSELRRFHATTRFRDNALDYLQDRFMKAGADIRKIASAIEVKIPRQSEEPWFDDSVLYKIASLSEMPVLHLKDESRSAPEFETWLSILARRCAEKINLEQEVKVDMESLHLLHHHLGASFKFLFWLAAEALENVIRHSQATRLTITVAQPENSRIRLAIVDNGEGLVRTSGTEKPDGHGLRAIQNLGQSTGGTVRFGRDENNHGLAIEILWDLESG